MVPEPPVTLKGLEGSVVSPYPLVAWQPWIDNVALRARKAELWRQLQEQQIPKSAVAIYQEGLVQPEISWLQRLGPFGIPNAIPLALAGFLIILAIKRGGAG